MMTPEEIKRMNEWVIAYDKKLADRKEKRLAKKLANTGNIKLYYPSVDNNGMPLDQMVSTKIYKNLCAEVCNITGGLTVTPCSGMYVNQLGVLIEDDISLIVAYTDKLSELEKVIRSNAMLILKSLNQESVLIEINDKIEFIT